MTMFSMKSTDLDKNRQVLEVLAIPLVKRR